MPLKYQSFNTARAPVPFTTLGEPGRRRMEGMGVESGEEQEGHLQKQTPVETHMARCSKGTAK